MLRLILGMSLLLITMSVAQGVEVDVTGHGQTINEALNDAKVEAANYVAGSFVSSKQTLDNDKFSEVVVQYSGAIIKRLTINSKKLVNGQYILKVTADVDQNKVNEVIVEHGLIIDATNVVKMINHSKETRKNIAQTWKDLDKVVKPYYLNVMSSKFINRPGVTTGYFRIGVGFQPKWISDAMALTEATAFKDQTITREQSGKQTCFVIDGQEQCWSVPFCPSDQDTHKFMINLKFVFIYKNRETKEVYIPVAISSAKFNHSDYRGETIYANNYEEKEIKVDLPEVRNTEISEIRIALVSKYNEL